MMTAIAVAALFLYPLALGWGDWDAYRPGWGSWSMLMALFVICAICWLKGLYVLPSLIVVALLAWSFGLNYSGQLGDGSYIDQSSYVGIVDAGLNRLFDRFIRGRLQGRGVIDACLQTCKLLLQLDQHLALLLDLCSARNGLDEVLRVFAQEVWRSARLHFFGLIASRRGLFFMSMQLRLRAFERH